jgi:hypothetical protein
LYKLKEGLKQKTMTMLKNKLKIFEERMEPIIRKIQAANTKAGIFVKRTMSKGRSMNTTSAIKKNTRLFLYWGDVVDAKTFQGPLTYTYGADITNKKAGEVFIDGLGREKDLARTKWRLVNGIRINHKCIGHNLKTEWLEEKVSGIWYVAFSALRDIEAGEELFSNYNEGKSKKKYWRKVDTLKRLGVAEKDIVLCNCRSALNKRKCPNNYAYDAKEMRAC